MNHTAERPSVPYEATEVETPICTHCEDDIDGEWQGGDEFGPLEFNPGEHISWDGDQYIHDHCKLPKIANDLTAEDRFKMVRLVAAMSIISEASDDLLARMDRQDLFSFDLAGMKKAVDWQLDKLNDEACTFGEPELVLVRSRDLKTATWALAGSVSRAELDYKRSLDDPDCTPVMSAVKKDIAAYLTSARDNCKEATA